MDEAGRRGAAERLLADFAVRTGIDGPDAQARRYLWTDAAAVEAWVAIHKATDAEEPLRLARALVAQVHRVLGRHRPEDARRGWISGLDERAGEARPTAGGLRIGKPLPERRVDERFDERLEWDRDGQYFHYLTRWMEALDTLALATGESRWNAQAVELAQVATGRFVHRPQPAAPARMCWKMSIDLSRPLVPSMGQHDPLDGYATMLGLRATRRLLSHGDAPLAGEIATFAQMCAASEGFATGDSLGLGGLLGALARLVRSVAAGEAPFDRFMMELLARLLGDAQRSIGAFVQGHELARPPATRLAFRELGLAIGLRSLPAARAAASEGNGAFGPSAPAIVEHLDMLLRHLPLADRIEGVWRTPDLQRRPSWTDHEDINAAMLARSLVADES
jgi:hypothetical protein